MKAISSTVDDCDLLDLPKIGNPAGNITVIEPGKNIPFEVRRIYYLYDVPGGAYRGGHSHEKLEQLLIAASGSFDVILDDGKDQRVVTLSRPYQGIRIVPGIWRELRNFASGSICLVLASDPYDESDYIRDIETFSLFKQSCQKRNGT